jgi:hypothetical protein
MVVVKIGRSRYLRVCTEPWCGGQVPLPPLILRATSPVVRCRTARSQPHSLLVTVPLIRPMLATIGTTPPNQPAGPEVAGNLDALSVRTVILDGQRAARPDGVPA